MDPLHEKSHGRYAVYGVIAYSLWGLIPLYFKTVAEVAPLEVLAHRAVWSFVTLMALVALQGRWDEIRRVLANKKLLLMMSLNAALIAGNWLTFIYAVLTGQVLQSSLGYFLCPLGYVLLGVLFLRERLRPFQILAIALATVGFLVLAGIVGQMPWIALSLTFTASFHLLIRKIAPIDGFVSLVVETLVMAPIALIYLGGMAVTTKLTGTTSALFGMLMLAGPVTSVPFLFFGAAAKHLRLSTMGIIQYLTPTLQFLLAVLVFKEPFSMAQLVSFACVWTAVAIYTTDSYRASQEIPLDPID
jgi:chloramphenicol-sensitive protein RarD